MHGTASELAVTKAAKMLVAVPGFTGQARQRPVLLEMAGDPFPEQAQGIIVLHRSGEAQNVAVNEIDPVLNEGRFASDAAFVNQPQDG